MVSCSVLECAVTHRNNPENYTFHRFPLDPVMRSKWLRLIRRVGWSPKTTSSICSKHFLDEYKRKNRIYTILVKGAIPTLFVPGLNQRVASSYVNRDIVRPTTSQDQNRSTSQDEEDTSRSPRVKKLLNKIDKLKQKLKEKQRKIRSLAIKNKRQAVKIVTLQDVLKEIHSRPGLKDHYSEINEACSNDLIQN